MAKHILFAYGTLKRTFHNHYLLEKAEYLGTGYTRSKYALYASGIPFVVKNEEISHIHGELYQIDEITLKKLDRLEGHPDWYCRERVEIVSAAGQILSAWMYFFPQATGELNITGIY